MHDGHGTNLLEATQTGTGREHRKPRCPAPLYACADILNLVRREFEMALRGYSSRQVDELFARMDAGQVTAADLRDARFDKQLRGYAPRDVDAALNEELRRLEDDGE